jgi:predicted Rossmann fold nucleotide-binding protein DprA/Smf involved in DNA uptake
MEYQTLIPKSPKYPKRLLERLGESAPAKIFYWGPLDFLKRFTMAVISADSISGLALMATNQLLFTIREYDLNIIGGWHSVMETEIFRLGLFRKNFTVTLFTAKGLEKETFDSFLETRFYPPLHEFPEREEYFRRAKEGNLLILSVSPPDEASMKRPNIIYRNSIACALADVVFVPFAEKGTKTFTLAKRVLSSNTPVFTTDHESNYDLHQAGIPGFTRKTVGKYLEQLGARQAQPVEKKPVPITISEPFAEVENKSLGFIQEKLNL